MSADKLINVTLQVLVAHLVVRALVPPLEHSPKGLNSVGMYFAVNVLVDAVFHSGMAERQVTVSGSVIVVNLSVWQAVIANCNPLTLLFPLCYQRI